MADIEKITDEFLNKAEQVFSQGQLHIDEIKAFVQHEKHYNWHMNPNLYDRYTRLFTIIRDRIILPNAGKLEFADLFEDIGIMIRQSKVQLQPHPQIPYAIEALTNSISQNDYRWQYRLVRVILVLQTCNNIDGKEEFIKRLFNIPSATCFESMNDAHKIATVIRSLFPTCTDLMKCAEKVVYDDSFFEKDLFIQRSNLMWVLEVIWNVVFRESPEHMVIFPRWVELFQEAIKRDDKELVFYMHMPLSHVYLNMCHTQEDFKKFNDLVEMPLSKYIQKNMRKWGFKPNKKKLPEISGKKIAFVYDRIVPNSPVKLLISLLSYLKESTDLELYVYDLGYIEKAVSNASLVNEIKYMGVNYINNHDLILDISNGHHYSHYEKAVALREQALKDDIDIIVSMGNRLASGFVFATRTAPMQIFWDHGNHEYDVKNIDKRICHFDDGYSNNLGFEKFELNMLQKYLGEEEEKNKQKAIEIKKNLPKHEVVLGSIGRLMKLSSEYISAVADILDENKDAIYLACGSGNTEELREKAIAAGIDMERFIMTGWIDPHVYGHVIDIYLNTFPLTGGESVNEFIAKGEDKYVVNINN
jgi:hypothetical protein